MRMLCQQNTAFTQLPAAFLLVLYNSFSIFLEICSLGIYYGGPEVRKTGDAVIGKPTPAFRFH